MKVLISGATGLIGTELSSLLTTGGHEVIALTRRASAADGKAIAWDPDAGRIEQEKLAGFDAVVHLAGESIAKGRWTEEKKRRIMDSRILGTTLLSEALAKLEQPPRVLISASAIGYYGDRGDEELTEECAPGNLFVSQVCKKWEATTAPAAERGIRVVHPRIGVVLSPKGGALATMLTPFRMGVGGKIGSGKQYMAWIALDDLARIFEFSMHNESLRGPVNAVAPNPVTNAEFTKTLGKVLSRPTIFPMPAFAARLAFGEVANELLLASAKVMPRRLLDSGFQFGHPELEEALRFMLGKQR